MTNRDRGFLTLAALVALAAPCVPANGVSWGPPQLLLPYEAAVVLIEGLVFWFVLRAEIIRTFMIALVANFVSWVAGLAFLFVQMIATAALVDGPQEWKLLLVDIAAQVAVLFLNIFIEGMVWIQWGNVYPNRRFVSTLIIVNVVTWSLGVLLLSLMV